MIQDGKTQSNTLGNYYFIFLDLRFKYLCFLTCSFCFKNISDLLPLYIQINCFSDFNIHLITKTIFCNIMLKQFSYQNTISYILLLFYSKFCKSVTNTFYDEFCAWIPAFKLNTHCSTYYEESRSFNWINIFQ